MDRFQSMTRMDRRKFLAGFLATAASAGVLGKLGVSEQEYNLADYIYEIEPQEAPLFSVGSPFQNGGVSHRWVNDELRPA